MNNQIVSELNNISDTVQTIDKLITHVQTNTAFESQNTFTTIGDKIDVIQDTLTKVKYVSLLQEGKTIIESN